MKITQESLESVKTGGAIYLYVLELDGKDFYVGITRDVDQRHRRHESGKGALWTSGRRSVRRLMHADTGVDNYPAAEKLEDEVTLMLMARHGIDRVRGGHYCALAREDIDAALRAHGHWEHVRRSGMERVSFDTQASWSDALDAFLVQALRYYDGGYTDAQREAVFLEGCRLTRYAYWHDDFAPGLDWVYWGKRGVLPVLLSFKYDRTVGSRALRPYDVLRAALSRTRNGAQQLHRLFLLCWQAWRPDAKPEQQAWVDARVRELDARGDHDHRYDALTSILLPETRSLLRSR